MKNIYKEFILNSLKEDIWSVKSNGTFHSPNHNQVSLIYFSDIKKIYVYINNYAEYKYKVGFFDKEMKQAIKIMISKALLNKEQEEFTRFHNALNGEYIPNKLPKTPPQPF